MFLWLFLLEIVRVDTDMNCIVMRIALGLKIPIKNALQYLPCILYTMFSPTCFGRHFGQRQGDVIITRIQTYKSG